MDRFYCMYIILVGMCMILASMCIMLVSNAGITCEIGTVNKMATGKLLLFFLPLHPSKTGLLQERIV